MATEKYLKRIFEYTQQGIDHVLEQFACPECGEIRTDFLYNDPDDGDEVTCTTCGTHYRLYQEAHQ